jgi:hypothetical protein
MEWHYVMLHYILHYIITSWFHNSIIKFYCYLLLLSFSVPGAAQPEAWGGAASASIREEISATPGNLGQEKARLGHNLDRMDKRVATQWRHWRGQRLSPTLTATDRQSDTQNTVVWLWTKMKEQRILSSDYSNDNKSGTQKFRNSWGCSGWT